ncbi:lipid II:glycine glycyltransferase FemX [Haloarchaeobius sp. HRN-SO-5]|uniref:lipid II:glycine glycyltransferase FemX n=1 Tax=Haloarchaeobius sp. HRN-SO-5 TaxID=3446118 RepID=UPI003EBE2CA9
MSYEIVELGPEERDRWNDLVRMAPHGTPFHLYESLEVLADHSGTQLHALLSQKGQEPVGLFPFFERSVGPVPVAFSPPPDLKVEYLGPVLTCRQPLKRRKRENRLRHLVDDAIDWLDEHVSPRFVNVRTGATFDDPRPFVWNGWTVVPRHTYVVDLTQDEDDLLMAFSSDARNNIRAADKYDVSVYEGAHEAIDDTVELVRRRHAEQGLDYPLSAETVRALYDAVPDGVLRPYVCELDGQFVGGCVTLELGDTILVWLGTAENDVPIDPNDILDWHAMCEGRARGAERCDLVGANNERISDYKAKFAPELETYYRLQRTSKPASVAANLYQRLR